MDFWVTERPNQMPYLISRHWLRAPNFSVNAASTAASCFGFEVILAIR